MADAIMKSRGICPDCKREVSVCDDGTVQVHNTRPTSGARCSGAQRTAARRGRKAMAEPLQPFTEKADDFEELKS